MIPFVHTRWAAVTAVLALALISLIAAPAAASVDVGDDLHQEYDACIAKFTASHLRDLVDQLDRSKHVFVIRRSAGTAASPSSDSEASNGFGTGGTTKWNPTDTDPFPGDGVRADPCATLYHEMSHLADYDKGTNRRDSCSYTHDGNVTDTGITAGEVKATRKENEYRQAQNPPLPQRTAYGKGTSLPPAGTECLPAPPQRPSGSGCGASCAVGGGDPHMETFDARHYDFQAVGEFILTRAAGGDLEVQGRTSPVGGLRTVSLFSAAAANVAGDRVGLYRRPSGLAIRIGGSPAELPIASHTLPKGGTIEVMADQIELRWPDGSALEVRPVGTAALRLSLRLADTRRGKVQGLFGNFDGKAEGDLVVRGGGTIGEKPSFESLYRSFGDSWRVAQNESLFDYAPGQSTEMFTDRTFPDKPTSANDLPNRGTAEAICRRAGVNEPRTLEDCILDVGLTGEVAFATDAVSTQQLVSTIGTALLTVAQPGGEAQLTFRGAAGRKVFVEVTASTVPDQCSPLELRDPANKQIATGCIINKTGFVDATTLPVDGEYRLVVKPGHGTGQVNVRVVTVFDQELTTTPNGPALVSTIAQPGAVTRLRFPGTAGQRIFLGVSSTSLPDQCSPLELRDPANKQIAAGCIINGRGIIDGTLLPTTGQYTIVVDPYGTGTGTSRLRLVASVDRTGTIAIDGPPVTVEIAQPGAVTRLQFLGAAGQKVALVAESATLPDQCSPLNLLGPTGALVASGCIINGKGDIDATILPENGTYTIVVDPHYGATGSARLLLRTGG